MTDAPPLRLSDLGRLHAPLRHEMDAAVKSVIDRGAFILGQEVRDFEADFARYCGVARAVGTDNGTSALELIFRALGIGAGDEVVVPAMTFVATASAVSMVGATPVLVDIDPKTNCIDMTAALAAVTPRTRAVVPVHLYGYPAPLGPLLSGAHGKFQVVEDCCQAHGAKVGSRRVGSLGVAAAFSFYPAKNLGCFGDGGAVVTDDPGIADRVAQLRNYGERKKYEHMFLAYNRRLDTVQAAVLKVKLPRLDDWNADRRRVAAAYRTALAGTRLVLPPEPAEGEHVQYMFAVRTKEREALQAHFKAGNIETGIHYPYPLHLLPVFADLGHRAAAFPHAEALARETLSLPMFPGMTADEVGRVAAAVKAFERAA